MEKAFLSWAHLEGASLLGAHLEGAYLSEAHLEGANLYAAHLGGKQMLDDELIRVRKWKVHLAGPDFPTTLAPAYLGGAFFDATTSLEKVILGDIQYGLAWLADIHWGGADLAKVDWAAVRMPGEEGQARQQQTLTGWGSNKLRDYQTAVRVNSQLAIALRNQGLNEPADEFAYRAKALQRQVLRQQGQWGQWAFSVLLAAMSGYGYRLRCILAAYGLVLLVFAAAFYGFGRV
jgi:hypothetical protein